MQSTILVPLDGSAFGEDVLPTALMLADQLKAGLHLVHIHESIMLVYANHLVIGQIPTLNTPLDDQCRADEQTYLDRLAEQLRGAGITVSTTMLTGPVGDTIGTAAAADMLIVMSTHARIGLNRTVLGSLADELIRHSATPVLLVHVQPADMPDLPVPPINHVLIALDGSALSGQIVPVAELVGGTFQAEFTLLHVLDQDSTSSQRAAMQNYLTAIATKFASDPACVHTVMVTADHPANAVVDYARQHNADLIALATHGRSGLSRLVFGSVADRIIHAADRPVLIYRPEGHV